MMQAVWSWLDATLGLGVPGAELDFVHMASRGVVVFVLGILAVRVVAHRRFVSRHAPFDVILGIMLGAIMARAINGTAPFLPTLGSAVVLLVLDHLIAVGVYRWAWFRHLVAGRSEKLVHDGELDRKSMQRFHINREDLLVELRRQGHLESLANLREAYLEPTGDISLITIDKEREVS